VENIFTVGSNAVDVIVTSGEFTTQEPAWFMFHKLLEPIFVQLLIFHVVVFVLFHICLVLEGKLTRRPIAMEMSRSLTSVQTVRRMTIFGTSKTEKSFPLDGIVFPVVIEVHLNIGCAYVNLVTALTLDAVVMGLFLVM